jgi:hypothetical protein
MCSEDKTKEVVFISHKGNQKMLAIQFKEKLKLLDIDSVVDFIDFQLDLDNEEEILRQIQKSTRILVLVDSLTQSSQWVTKELKWAMNIGKPISYCFLEEPSFCGDQYRKMSGVVCSKYKYDLQLVITKLFKKEFITDYKMQLSIQCFGTHDIYRMVSHTGKIIEIKSTDDILGPINISRFMAKGFVIRDNYDPWIEISHRHSIILNWDERK